MSVGVLVAGIGNIFQGDDAFGSTVAQRFARKPLPEYAVVMDIGIRSIDLVFALLHEYDLTILVDAMTRGGAPGTVYTIEIDSDDIPNAADELALTNSHGLDSVKVLAMAKGMGAKFGRLLLVGCEPLIVDQDETGYIGLSEPVAAAVEVAERAVRGLVEEFAVRTTVEEEEVCSQ